MPWGAERRSWLESAPAPKSPLNGRGGAGRGPGHFPVPCSPQYLGQGAGSHWLAHTGWPCLGLALDCHTLCHATPLFQANAIGRGAKSVREFLEKNYTDEAIETDDLTIKLVIRALLEVSPPVKPGQDSEAAQPEWRSEGWVEGWVVWVAQNWAARMRRRGRLCFAGWAAGAAEGSGACPGAQLTAIPALLILELLLVRTRSTGEKGGVS